MAPKPTVPSVESIASGLAKLYREVGKLRTEVAAMARELRGFKKMHPLPIPKLPVEVGQSWRVRPKTDEPRSAIQAMDYEFADKANLEVPTRTLMAIAKDLDGALLDIRAARVDISAIAGDSDLRREFLEWQKDD